MAKKLYNQPVVQLSAIEATRMLLDVSPAFSMGGGAAPEEAL